jgi:transcriptional regulator with XRE-family HTH domain
MTPHEFREMKGLSQREMAQQIGCSQPYIHKIETGKAKPSGDVIIRYRELSRGKVKPEDFPGFRRAA